MKRDSFLQRYATAAYFFLAYGITWGLILLVAGNRSFTPAKIQLSDGIFIYLAMLAGPSISSIILTVLLEGKPGLRALFAGIRIPTDRRWFVPAIVTVPVTVGLILVLLSVLVSEIYRPEISLTKLALGLVIGGLAGFIEEIGWTGFALPRLLNRYSVWKSGLLLGLLWALWHVNADFWGNYATYGSIWFVYIVCYWILPLTAYRILMAWVYRSSGSLLVAQVMHMFYTGTLVVLSPATSVVESLVWQVPFAIALWLIVLVVYIRRKLTVSAVMPASL